MVLYYCDLLFGLYLSSLCFATTTFQGIGGPTEVSLIDQANREGSPDDKGRAIPRNVVVEKHRDDG
jgi:hypothetical protein